MKNNPLKLRVNMIKNFKRKQPNILNYTYYNNSGRRIGSVAYLVGTRLFFKISSN